MGMLHYFYDDIPSFGLYALEVEVEWLQLWRRYPSSACQKSN